MIDETAPTDPHCNDLQGLVVDWARGIEAADARRPVAVNQRSKQAFQPGIGPHTEAAAVALVMAELRAASHAYDAFGRSVPYETAPRRKCDLCLGAGPSWAWAIELKLL